MGDGAEATVLDAPQIVAQEAPTDTTSQAQGTSGQTEAPAKADKGEGTAPPAAQTAAQNTTVDIDTLLQNEEHRKTLRQKLLESDPDLKKEIEHRAKSVRQTDFERAVEARLQAVLAQQAAERELEQREAALRAKLEAEPYDLGVQHQEEVKGQLSALEQQRQTQARAIQQAQLRGEITPQVAQELYETLSEAEYQRRVMADPDLTDEEKSTLNWRDPKWTSREDWLKAVDDTRIERKVKKLAKELAKVEAEALVQERLDKDREGQESIPNTPNGTAQSTDEFLAAYGSGKSGDTARMMRQMKDWGII